MKSKLRNNLKQWGFMSTVLFLVIITGCNNDYYPKPKGYFRIDLPEKVYAKFDSTYPYVFEYPVYAKVLPDNQAQAEEYWINLNYSQFHGTLYMSYKRIDGNLNKYLEDTRTMVMKHIPKASSIENKQYQNDDSKVYGLTYTILGVAAASPFQFYLTDSVNHFVRGALYFSTVPNNDSLAPVISFIEEDINHMIETFEWK